MHRSYNIVDRPVHKGDPNPASGIGFKYGLDMNSNRTTKVFDNKKRRIPRKKAGIFGLSTLVLLWLVWVFAKPWICVDLIGWLADRGILGRKRRWSMDSFRPVREQFRR